MLRKQSLKLAASGAKIFAKKKALQQIIFNGIRLERDELGEILSDRDLKFLGYCLARKEWSRSQILQDLWVCFELGEKPGGYFVEFGATNGLVNSNTWLLETRFGWKGILAEPNPVWHEELKANRSANIEDLCVFSRSGETVEFLTTDDSDPELSSIAQFSEGDHFAGTRQSGGRLAIGTISLTDLLTKYDAPEVIDYISIDTEGSELDILKPFDFDRFKFRLLSVELNPKTEPEIQQLLESQGYERVFPAFSQWDGWFRRVGGSESASAM
ncbi:FkbM family methyltransferase [Rhodobacterales bacterium]|nr:FkbM family methyltransferase [Rhodobacterales bacterium]